MGKIIAVLVGILTIWGALAQIMPEVFQIRSEGKLMPFVWGKKSIWIAVMAVGCLLGWYIWTLEGRLNALASAPRNPSIDETGLSFLIWSSPDNSSCSAGIDASKLPTDFTDKFEIALVCGYIDPSVDQMKDTRITISQLFTPQNAISISVPFSKTMSEALAQDRRSFVNRIQPRPPRGSKIPIVNNLWMRAVLLPKGFDISNVHRLSDVTANGGKIGAQVAGCTIITNVAVE